MRSYRIIVLFILGLLVRLWLINLFPQPFVFDQLEYDRFARGILEKGVFAETARLYGYPLFLAIIYKFFGVGNLIAVTVFQSILDCISGLLIYLIGRKIFRNYKIALTCYLLYLINPFTSAFAGVVLSEVLATFLLTLGTFMLIVLFEKKESRVIYLSGLILGYLPQVRSSFLFYSLILVILVTISVARHKSFRRKAATLIIFLALYFLPFTYNILGNWVYFRQISLTTVDNLFVRELYISLFVSGRSTIHPKNNDAYPKEIQALYAEYSSKPQNELERSAMAKKYLNLSIQEIMKDPRRFIISRIAKTWYVWEKRAIFLYNQPGNNTVDFLTYWGNNLFLLGGIYGLNRWGKLKQAGNIFEWRIIIIFSIIYISILHSFSATDERYSLPGYPLIFLFAGYGMWDIMYKVIPNLFRDLPIRIK